MFLEKCRNYLEHVDVAEGGIRYFWKRCVFNMQLNMCFNALWATSTSIVLIYLFATSELSEICFHCLSAY